MAEKEKQLWKAIKEGRYVDAQILIESGADTICPNINDNELTALDLSQLTGDYKFFKYVSYKNRERNVKTVTERFPSLVETFLTLPDFQMNFKWRVYSWIPFISAFCPKDEWKLTKVGGKLRIDTSLANWSGYRFTKGSISVFFDASTGDMLDSFIAIDTVNGQRVSVMREIIGSKSSENGEEEDREFQDGFDKDIQDLLKMDLLKATILVDQIKIREIKTGIFRKKPKVCLHDKLFHATQYELSNIKIRFMQYYYEDFGKEGIFERHPNEFKNDLRYSKKHHKTSANEKNEVNMSIEDDESNNEERLNAILRNAEENHDGEFDYQTGSVKTKGAPKPHFHEKTYSGKFWCSQDFPVQPYTLIPFLEALSPFKETARNIISILHLFDVGTPVKGEISVFPTVKVEFQFCDYNGNVDEYNDYVNLPPEVLNTSQQSISENAEF